MCDQLEEGELSEVVDDSAASEDSDKEWRPQGSLPVAPIDSSFDPNAEPTSGEEYLRLVRYGAWQLPFAVRAKEEQLVSVTTSLGDPVSELDKQLNEKVPPTPGHLLPSNEFIDSFMKSFLEGCPPIQDEHIYDVVETSGSYPSLDRVHDWYHLLYPRKDGESKAVATGPVEDDATDVSVAEAISDDLSHVKEQSSKRFRRCSIEPDDLYRAPPSQRQLMQLVKYHCRWIASSEPRTITLRQYQFVMRILQLLDTRITPWQASCLRDLATLMIRLRRERILDEDGTNTCDHQTVLFCVNGIIVAIAKRFGQTDLLTK